MIIIIIIIIIIINNNKSSVYDMAHMSWGCFMVIRICTAACNGNISGIVSHVNSLVEILS